MLLTYHCIGPSCFLAHRSPSAVEVVMVCSPHAGSLGSLDVGSFNSLSLCKRSGQVSFCCAFCGFLGSNN